MSSSRSVPRDIREFLDGYPSQTLLPISSASTNLDFYENKKTCEPDGLLYEEFMQKFQNDFVELEMNHGYIQWFFPIREHGVNPQAQPLQPKEIEMMSKNAEVVERLLRSYKMMLAFYGIEFNEGRLKARSDHRERFLNLQKRPRNLLRLTRILKHLSEFQQLQHHAAPLVLFFVSQHCEGRIDFSENKMHGESMDRGGVSVLEMRARGTLSGV